MTARHCLAVFCWLYKLVLMNFCARQLVIIFGLFGALPLMAQAAHQSVEHYSEVGNRALAEGRYADAEQAFEKLKDLAPEMAEVHAKIQGSYGTTGRPRPGRP